MNAQKQTQNTNAAPELAGLENFKAIAHRAANFPDLLALAVHRIAAEHLRKNPKLLSIAKNNLRNWLNNDPAVGAWLEWKEILETESFENILKIITAETDEGQRLRSSSPFAGIISKKEWQRTIEICAEAKPF